MQRYCSYWGGGRENLIIYSPHLKKKKKKTDQDFTVFFQTIVKLFAIRIVPQRMSNDKDLVIELI